ncbi:hypothetical protein F5884DRAFT_247005 [Xylogone sp. PMI_703]|nr:hypothetical protein F5884DRAFT_247005 [Xylogone sp. PMI_703]
MPRDKGDETTRSQEAWTRSTAACNGCRQRKQKCGGEKPVCARCHTLNQTCVWPKQQKRGPAKGYIEALEARLYETEAVLLKILSATSIEQVSSIFTSEAGQTQTSNVPDTSVGTSPVATSAKSTGEQRKSILEFWNQFPLTTSADIFRWHSARQLGGGGGQLNTGIISKLIDGDEPITISSDSNVVMDTMAESYNNDAAAESTQGYQDAILLDDGRESKNQSYGEGDQLYQQHEYTIDCQVPIQGERRHSLPEAVNTESTGSESTEINRFGLTKEFRDAFLW